jgi:hypothetical protein
MLYFSFVLGLDFVLKMTGSILAGYKVRGGIEPIFSNRNQTRCLTDQYI